MKMIKFIEKRDLLDLKRIIENEEQCSLQFVNTIGGNSLNLINVNSDTELYIKAIYDKLIISRIFLNKQHQGLGTSIFEECKNICKKKQMNYIIIESVTSIEMIKFCNKFKFYVDKNTAIEYNGYVFGNYIYKM